jgi:formylglycine-generating enzyme required for sulfatase activity
VRGGAWVDNSLYSRCASRDLYEPLLVYDYLGLRVVRGPRRTRS